MYRVQVLEAATRDLERLDNVAGRRIAERIDWLAAHLDSVRPEPLTGALSGLYKFRVGDYRVLYEILREEQLILIHAVGHRKDIYRQR